MSDSEPLGSAADEAARLLDAVRRWIDDRTPGTVEASPSAECRYCPFCQVAGALRQGQPEVFEHMSHAMESLIAAVRAGVTAHEHEWSKANRPDVEHIDIR